MVYDGFYLFSDLTDYYSEKIHAYIEWTTVQGKHRCTYTRHLLRSSRRNADLQYRGGAGLQEELCRTNIPFFASRSIDFQSSASKGLLALSTTSSSSFFLPFLNDDVKQRLRMGPPTRVRCLGINSYILVLWSTVKGLGTFLRISYTVYCPSEKSDSEARLPWASREA